MNAVDLRSLSLGTLRVPSFAYGTAWKEDETERLVTLAIAAGFRAIDTANQRKHYHEVGVGKALATALASGKIKRESLFIQTKFTSPNGQDHRLPYDAIADAKTQVAQSFASSLEHLQVDHVESYVLHGPSTRSGFGKYDREVWSAMESIADSGKARVLGVSNVALDQLEALYAHARVKPSIVQNRCYTKTGWDRAVRAFCRERGIVYQGFSLLTANRTELKKQAFAALVTRLGRTPAQIVFRYALQVGMQPLTGTTSADHMREDLSVFDFELSPADVSIVETLGSQ